MFMRYTTLVTLAAASLYAVVSVGETSGQQILVDAGQVGGNPNTIAFWMLGAIATLTGLSLCRFVVFGIPTMIGGWYHQNKEWLYTLVLGGVVCGVYYLM
jgi:hypothetical protein